jgi:hypothetical protein
MPTYCFWWDNGEEQFLMEIDADPKTVKKLLHQYRKEDENYDDLGWLDFLNKKGIKAEIVDPIEIYF